MDQSVCRHWHRGRCRLGEKCKFNHPEQLGNIAPQEVNVAKKPKWCRHTRLEDCRFNGGCVYWHVEEYEALPTNERPRDLPPLPRFQDGNNSSQPPPPPMPSQAIASQRMNRPVPPPSRPWSYARLPPRAYQSHMGGPMMPWRGGRDQPQHHPHHHHHHHHHAHHHHHHHHHAHHHHHHHHHHAHHAHHHHHHHHHHHKAYPMQDMPHRMRDVDQRDVPLEHQDRMVQGTRPPAPSAPPLPANGSSENGKVPCRYFPTGACSKGESCPFSHQMDGSDQPSNIHVPEHLKEKFFEQVMQTSDKTNGEYRGYRDHQNGMMGQGDHMHYRHHMNGYHPQYEEYYQPHNGYGPYDEYPQHEYYPHEGYHEYPQDRAHAYSQHNGNGEGFASRTEKTSQVEETKTQENGTPNEAPSSPAPAPSPAPASAEKAAAATSSPQQ